MPASPKPTHYMLIIFAKPEAKCLTDLLKEIGGFFFSFCFNVSFRHSCQIFAAWLRCYLLLDRGNTTRLGAIHFSKRVSSINIKRTVACWNARDYFKLAPCWCYRLADILSQCFSPRISCVLLVLCNNRNNTHHNNTLYHTITVLFLNYFYLREFVSMM